MFIRWILHHRQEHFRMPNIDVGVHARECSNNQEKNEISGVSSRHRQQFWILPQEIKLPGLKCFRLIIWPIAHKTVKFCKAFVELDGICIKRYSKQNENKCSYRLFSNNFFLCNKTSTVMNLFCPLFQKEHKKQGSQRLRSQSLWYSILFGFAAKTIKQDHQLGHKTTKIWGPILTFT